MTIRPAEMKDLEDIKKMYREIIDETARQGRPIWGGDYPVEFLHEDISNKRMYILLENDRPVAAVALCHSIWDDSSVEYEDANAEARYIERLAVRPDHWRMGLSRLMMEEIEKTAREKGAEYLRLFVLESNKPAYSLYEKIGFRRIGGVHDIPVDEHFTLHTDVMEKRISRKDI